VDDSQPLGHRLRAIQDGSRTLALALALTICSCASPEPQRLTPWPAADFSQLTKSIAALRGLPFGRDIAFDDRSAKNGGIEAMRPRVEEYLGLPVLQVEQAYRSVGFLPYGADLANALADYRRLENLVRYDAVSETVTVAGEAARLGAPFEKTHPRAARETPAVIGIIKALQHHYFKWPATIGSTDLEDRRLAFRALAVGDALLAVIARANNNEKLQLSSADLAAARGMAAELDKLGASLPGFLREQLSFPYREGVQFVNWAFAALGWEGVNALYTHPPLTTAEIIHPEKYFIRRAGGLRIFPAGLIRFMGASPILEQSFGESLIRPLLAGEYGSKYASEAAAGWRADQLFSFQTSSGAVTAWFSIWANEKQAREFYRSYQSALESAQRLRFQPASPNPDPVLTAFTRDRGAFLLQVEGAAVLLLNATPPSRLWEVQEEVWKDLAIEPELKARPFDSATRPGQ
jgi:hypothetical protein